MDIWPASKRRRDDHCASPRCGTINGCLPERDRAGAHDIRIDRQPRLKAAMDLGFVIQISDGPARLRALERPDGTAYGIDLAVVVQPRSGGAQTADVLGQAVAQHSRERAQAGAVIRGLRRRHGWRRWRRQCAGHARLFDVDVVSLIGGVARHQIPSHSSGCAAFRHRPRQPRLAVTGAEAIVDGRRRRPISKPPRPSARCST